MKIYIDSEIRIENVSKEILDYCKKQLTIKNPEVQKKKAMGFWTGNLPKEIKMYSRNGEDIIVPLGCIDDVWNIYPIKEDYNINFGIHEKLKFPENTLKPYDYQEKAINKMILAKRGILQAKCGSGKSIMAIEIIRRIGFKALIICHTKELLNQFVDYLTNDLNMQKGEYGIIASGKVEIGSLVTVALRQTLVNIDLLKYKFEWGTIVVDECVSGDTEILTEKGFMRFDNLDKNIKVAQFNNDRTIEFVKPIRYIEKECNSYISFKHKNVELQFSENHDIVYYDKGSNNIKKRKAKEYFEKKFRDDIIINCGKIKNTESQILSPLDKIGIMLQADGCVYHKGATETTWKLEFSKQNKINYFKELCNKANIEYKEYKKRIFKKQKWNDSYKFTIKLPNKNYKKLTNFLEIPKNINYAKEVLEEISKWDCYFRKDNTLEYDSIIYENIKYIATVATLAGIQCSKIYTLYKNNNRNILYRIYLYRMQNIHYYRFKKERIIKPKKMYCVEVPSNMIICKKDDFIFVTGNCHNIAGNVTYVSQYQKILSNLASQYRFGLSATPFRADGLTSCMYAIINKVKYKIEEQEIADKVIKAKIQPVYTNFEIPYFAQNTDGTLNYTKLPTVLSENNARNEQILNLLKENENNYCLILSDRLSGLKYLHEKLGSGLLIDGSQTTKKAKQEREEAIEKMRNKEEHFLFATLQLAREGLDIKPLNRLFLIAPTKNKAVLIQAVGRIERKDTNKDTPLVYDFIDNDIYYDKAWKSRKTIYKKNGNMILN